jgi:hypothetical protein
MIKLIFLILNSLFQTKSIPNSKQDQKQKYIFEGVF